MPVTTVSGARSGRRKRTVEKASVVSTVNR
jgi:hypothetical protein